MILLNIDRFFTKKWSLIVLSLHAHFSMPFFERYRSFFRWNDNSYETTEKTVSICAKKQKSQKMEFDHYAPGSFKYLDVQYCNPCRMTVTAVTPPKVKAWFCSTSLWLLSIITWFRVTLFLFCFFFVEKQQGHKIISSTRLFWNIGIYAHWGICNGRESNPYLCELKSDFLPQLLEDYSIRACAD